MLIFFTKISNTTHFGRIKLLKFKKFDVDFEKRIYVSDQEMIELTKNDKFNFIKSPSLLFNEVKNLDKSLMFDFKQIFNLTNTYLPSENGNSEINNDLFKQYYKQESVKSSSFSNVQKLFIMIDNELFYLNVTKPDFIFKLNFIKNKILLTNEDNLTKLILNLLNVLSLWFNLCILDLHAYVHYAYFKTLFVLIAIYRLLIKIEISLHKLILFNLFICKLECKFKGLRFRKIKPVSF